MTMYCPEMGQAKPADAIIEMGHNFKDTYWCQWKRENDAAARALLQSLRIRPRAIEFDEEWRGGARFHCLVTGPAHDKLWQRPEVAYETLLD